MVASTTTTPCEIAEGTLASIVSTAVREPARITKSGTLAVPDGAAPASTQRTVWPARSARRARGSAGGPRPRILICMCDYLIGGRSKQIESRPPVAFDPTERALGLPWVSVRDPVRA